MASATARGPLVGLRFIASSGTAAQEGEENGRLRHTPSNAKRMHFDSKLIAGRGGRLCTRDVSPANALQGNPHGENNLKRTENVRRNGKNVAVMGRIGPLVTALCQLFLGMKVVVTFF